MIPLVLRAASGRAPDIKVFGRDYDTPDGTCIRDYVHVEDLCSAHRLALDGLMQREGEAFGSQMKSPEAMEAFMAFTQKRAPDFSKLG